MQSACCSGRNYLRDQLREMEVRTASSGARAYRTTSALVTIRSKYLIPDSHTTLDA